MKHTIPVILLALSLAACDARQPQDVPPPPASPDTPAAAPAAPADVTPAPAQDPGSTPAAPAQPAPNAPPPTEPSPTTKPTASNAPAVESMAVARPSAKMSVAADLRYQFDAPVADGQPATLHLAAIPRVAAENLKVEVKSAPGLEIDRGTLALQKVDAAGVYRQQISVIRRTGAPEKLTVLVTMDMPEGTAFGFFSIPLAGGQIPNGNPAQKSDSVKQR